VGKINIPSRILKKIARLNYQLSINVALWYCSMTVELKIVEHFLSRV